MLLPVFGNHWAGLHLTKTSPPPKHLARLLSAFQLVLLSIYSKAFVCKVCISLAVLLIKLITRSSIITTGILKQNKNKTTSQLWLRRRRLGLHGMCGRSQLEEGVAWRHRAPWAASLCTSLRKGNESWHALSLRKSCLHLPPPTAHKLCSQVNANKSTVRACVRVCERACAHGMVVSDCIANKHSSTSINAIPIHDATMYN